MKLHVQRSGSFDARPLVFLHGVTDHAQAWAPVLGHLKSSRNRVAVDLRGHGGSPLPVVAHPDTISAEGFRLDDYVADLSETADLLGLETMVLIGHSLGGLVAQAFASRHPARVAGLALVASTCCARQNPFLSALVDDLLENRVRRAAAERGLRFPNEVRHLSMGDLDPKLGAWVRDEWCADERADPAWCAASAAVVGRLKLQTWFGAVAGLLDMDTTEALQALRIPVLCLHGEEDEMFPPALHLPLIGRAAAATPLAVEVFPGCGHNLPWHAPRELAAAIERFADRL